MLKKLFIMATATIFLQQGLHAQTVGSTLAHPAANSSLSHFIVTRGILARMTQADNTGLLNPQAYEYRPSPQVSRNVREEIIRALIAHGHRTDTLTPEMENTLRNHLGQADLMAEINREMRARGYNPDSVASAITYWLVNNYNIIHDHISSDAEDAGVLLQAQYLVSQQPDILNMSDAEKQSSAESLYWLATLQQFAYQQAKAGAPGYDLNSIVADAHAALMTYGIDAYQLQLTPQGFIPR